MGAWGCLAVAVFLMGVMVAGMPSNVQYYGWPILIFMLPLGLLWFVILSFPMVVYVLPERWQKNGLCLGIIGLGELVIFGGVIYSAFG